MKSRSLHFCYPGCTVAAMERVNKVLYRARIFAINTRDRRKLGNDALFIDGIHWSRNALKKRVRDIANGPQEAVVELDPEPTFLPAFLLRDRHQS